MRFPDITLAAFKPITLVEIPDEEVIIAGRMAKVKERWAVYDPPMAAQYDVEGLEFDPIKITMEAGAAYEMNALTRINQMGRATTLAFAWGDNLDAIASRYPGGVPRLPEETYSAGADPGEKEAKDNRYRRRIWLAPNALAASGTAEAYAFWALTTDGDLKDASAVVRRLDLDHEPVVLVTCLASGADPRPSQARLLAIRQYLHRDEIKPLTDVVTVQAPVVVPAAYDIGVYAYAGTTAATVVDAVLTSLNKLVVDQYWLGQDHTFLQINAACALPGVHSIRIRGPLTELEVDDTTAVQVTAVTVKPLGFKQ
jgi:phage-related baseplate assembly protein